jgi:hypothetical protein
MTSSLCCHGRSRLLRTTHTRGLTSPEIQRYQCLLVRSEGRWVSLHLYSFFFVFICNFYVFLIYISCFCIPEFLTGDRLLHADVGPVGPADYSQNRHHPRPEAAAAAVGGATVAGNLPAGEAKRVLRWIEQNFTTLTRTVPMAEIEDLPPSMLWGHLGHGSDCLGV